MPSPFPGMDPYLEDEALWPAFQHDFVACVSEDLSAGLGNAYQTCVCERRYGAAASGEQREKHLEIRRRDDDRLVTLLDVPGPANKTTAAGREAYLATRRQAREAGANLVEIDLLLQGEPTLEYSRDGLPEWDYAVTVTRATQPERYEIYTATLSKRLPRFRLPLAADDRDAIVDLQAAFTRCYDRAGFAARIDYRPAPPGPLREVNRRWLDGLLVPHRAAHERVAVAAYYLWQQEGCPHGRDREHWERAMKEWGRD